MRPDGLGELNVRVTLKAVSDQYIYMYYRSCGYIPKEVLTNTPPRQLLRGKMNSLRTTVRLETASKKHERLNRLQAFGIGQADTVAGTVSYEVSTLR